MAISMRSAPRAAQAAAFDLFSSAEEAWFWYVRCQRLRLDNARPSTTNARFNRPCDPDDIYLVAMRLHRQHLLHKGHLRVLAKYGLAECPPDYRCVKQRTDLVIWRQALDKLSEPLRLKGIILPAINHSDNTLITH